MKSITTLENIPDSLDIQEMMDVKEEQKQELFVSLLQQLNVM